MKIVEATWEMRNLGVSCTEITVGDDTPGAIKNAIANLKSHYLVVRVPTSRLHISQTLESQGFHFVEAAMEVGATVSPMKARLLGASDTIDMRTSDADLDRVQSFVRAGLFTSDRVALDDHFSKEQAANRYVRWLDDIQEGSGQVFEVEIDGGPVGFFTLEDKGNDLGHGALNGLYPTSQGQGLGRSLHRAILDRASGLGFSRYSSQVSSNNLPGLRAVLSAGMSIEGVNYVFVRHKHPA